MSKNARPGGGSEECEFRGPTNDVAVRLINAILIWANALFALLCIVVVAAFFAGWR